MSAAALFLADVEIEDVVLSWQKMSATTKDGILIFGALMVLTLVLIVWAAFIRRRRRRKRKHHYPKPQSEAALVQTQVSGITEPRLRRSRRRRREHRPKNPTLAETGGLPPIRDNDGDTPG